MKNWEVWLMETIRLAMFIAGAVAVAYKALDAWEKRKTAQYKEMDKRVEKVEGRVTANEECFKRHENEFVSIKDNAKELLQLIIQQFKK